MYHWMYRWRKFHWNVNMNLRFRTGLNVFGRSFRVNWSLQSVRPIRLVCLGAETFFITNVTWNNFDIKVKVPFFLQKFQKKIVFYKSLTQLFLIFIIFRRKTCLKFWGKLTISRLYFVSFQLKPSQITQNFF